MYPKLKWIFNMDYLKLINNSAIEAEYEELAERTIIKDLVDRNITGYNRMVTADFHEDEQVFARKDAFIPGCIYIFKYDGLQVQQGDLKFHDVMPVILALSMRMDPVTHKKYVLGINLNLMPKSVKAFILQEINDLDKNFFEKDMIIAHKQGKHVFSNILLRIFNEDSGMKFLQKVVADARRQGTEINPQSWAFRKYYFDNIKGYRLIDYWQWRFIPFLNYNGSIRGVNLKKVQQNNIMNKGGN